MALATDGGVVLRRFDAAWNVVRIMACGAKQFAIKLVSQPVPGAWSNVRIKLAIGSPDL
jgi:hypothetical protein